MKLIYLFTVSLLIALTSCQSIKENATEPKARDAAQWVRERSGFIENAVSAITHVAVYTSEKDTFERTRTLEIMNAIAGNVNALIKNEQVDSRSIQLALKIDEPYFGPIMDAVVSLIKVETANFEANGYEDLTIAILEAVAAGIKDGTTTN